MSDIIDTVQLQETDDAILTLFDITLPSGTLTHFFNGLVDGSNNIFFTQKEINGSVYPLKEYGEIPLKKTAF